MTHYITILTRSIRVWLLVICTYDVLLLFIKMTGNIVLNSSTNLHTEYMCHEFDVVVKHRGKVDTMRIETKCASFSFSVCLTVTHFIALCHTLSHLYRFSEYMARRTSDAEWMEKSKTATERQRERKQQQQKTLITEKLCDGSMVGDY